MKTPPFNPRLQAAIYDVLDNQLRDNNPPETKATLKRLLGQGIDRDEARRLIACVIVGEIFTLMKTNTPYDNKRFVSRLAGLPETPWLDDEV
jgi:hypothetical protein